MVKKTERAGGESGDLESVDISIPMRVIPKGESNILAMVQSTATLTIEKTGEQISIVRPVGSLGFELRRENGDRVEVHDLNSLVQLAVRKLLAIRGEELKDG